MRKPVAYLVAILVGAIVWFFFQNFKIEGTDSLRVIAKNEDLDSLPFGDSNEESKSRFSFPKISLGRSTPNASAAPTFNERSVVAKTISSQPQAPKQNPDTIRVASFHLQHFGSKAADPELTMNAVARVVRLFDVIALQGIQTGGEGSIADLSLKAGPQYAYLLASPASIAQQDELYAFIYNKNTIVADRGEGLYTLGDPDNLLRRAPLIGWFKAKKPNENDAFTFTLVNVNTERRHTVQELNVLDNVMHEVRQDWRDEDDVIMLGCFQRPETQLEGLGQVRGLVPAIRSVPTNLRGDAQTENILFRSLETDEFTGRSGVFQFLRAYNLSMDQASQVSEYLPVWAEFSIYEGGQQGRVAKRETEVSR